MMTDLVIAATGLQDGFDTDDIIYLATLITVSAAAALVVLRAVRAAWRCVHQISMDTAAVRLALYPERGPSILERIASLERELKPNGGSTLRDQTTRIETRQMELRTKMSALVDDVREIKEETDRQGDRLDRHIDKHGGFS